MGHKNHDSSQIGPDDLCWACGSKDGLKLNDQGRAYCETCAIEICVRCHDSEADGPRDGLCEGCATNAIDDVADSAVDREREDE